MSQTFSETPALLVDIRGVMQMLSCQTARGAYYSLSELNVKPVLRGKYYVKDSENAIARRSIANRKLQ